jgi:hypothetical protein
MAELDQLKFPSIPILFVRGVKPVILQLGCTTCHLCQPYQSLQIPTCTYIIVSPTTPSVCPACKGHATVYHSSEFLAGLTEDESPSALSSSSTDDRCSPPALAILDFPATGNLHHGAPAYTNRTHNIGELLESRAQMVTMRLYKRWS